jgi:hypothetical protein
MFYVDPPSITDEAEIDYFPGLMHMIFPIGYVVYSDFAYAYF